MKPSDFRWRGVLASEMGVIVTRQVQYKRPARRVTSYQVAGRSGSLISREPDAWEDVVYAPECALKPGASVEAAMKWLMGEGDLVFGSMPDHVFTARMSDAFDLQAMAEGHPGSYMLFTPIFVCHPLRRALIPEAGVTLTPTPVTCINRGNSPSWPVIHINAQGAADISLTIADQTLTIHMPSAGETAIDAELWRALPHLDGMAIEGGMPSIPTGTWTASCTVTGAPAAVTVTPRYRWV